MTLDEVLEQARRVEADPRFAVVAIGRFEMTDDLIASPREKFPWALSAVCRHDATYIGVLRNPEAVTEFLFLCPPQFDTPASLPPAKREPKQTAKPTKPESKPAPKPSKAAELQPSLF
jgi:cell division septation protein DedD